MHVTVINRDGSAEMISAEEDRTLLEVLQEAGKSVFAYCGGTKTCGRCKVLVRDDAGIRYELACETKARDGIEIILENSNVVDIAGMDELDTPSLLEGRRTALLQILERPPWSFTLSIWQHAALSRRSAR